MAALLGGALSRTTAVVGPVGKASTMLAELHQGGQGWGGKGGCFWLLKKQALVADSFPGKKLLLTETARLCWLRKGVECWHAVRCSLLHRGLPCCQWQA